MPVLLPPEPSLPPDAYFWLRAARLGWPFRYLDESLSVYRIHAGSISGAETMRNRTVLLWESFVFDDPACEAMRRANLAASYIGRGALSLGRADLASARSDLARARQTSPETQLVRRLALNAVAANRVFVAPAVCLWRGYRRLRPYRSPWMPKWERA
jgi:hypothetical protein